MPLGCSLKKSKKYYKHGECAIIPNQVVLPTNFLGLWIILEWQAVPILLRIAFSPISHVSTCLPLVLGSPPLQMWFLPYTIITQKKKRKVLLNIRSKNRSTIWKKKKKMHLEEKLKFKCRVLRTWILVNCEMCCCEKL